MAPRIDRNLLFIDSETTGLDHTKHEMLEVAAILTSPNGLDILDAYEAKLFPIDIGAAEPQALKVNGYSEVEWAPEKCTDRGLVAGQLHRMSSNAILVGHNVSFDENFATVFLKSCGMTPPWHYHKIDTMCLAWPLFCARKIDYFNLDTLCAYFKIPRTVHRAMADTKACRSVYLELMKILLAE
jgi:DNA polymerase-3 subunit epsilon